MRRCFLLFQFSGQFERLRHDDLDGQGPEQEQDGKDHAEQVRRVAEVPEDGGGAGHEERRDELAQVQRCRDQRHDGAGSRFARFHGALRDDERDTGAVGETDQGGSEQRADPAAEVQEDKAEQEDDRRDDFRHAFRGLHDAEEEEAADGCHDTKEKAQARKNPDLRFAATQFAPYCI